MRRFPFRLSVVTAVIGASLGVVEPSAAQASAEADAMSAAGARVARDTALAIRVRVDGAPEKTLARLTAVLDSLGYGPEATDYQAVSTKPRYLRGAGLWRLEASVVAAPAGSTLVITGEVRKLHRIALIFSAAGPPLPLGNDPRSELVWAKIREVADLVVQ